MTVWRVLVDAAVVDRLRSAPAAVRTRFAAQRDHLRDEPWRKGDRISRPPPAFDDLPNLYRGAGLPEGWRFLYFVGSNRAIPPTVFVAWLGTHKEYDRLLGYKG